MRLELHANSEEGFRAVEGCMNSHERAENVRQLLKRLGGQLETSPIC